MESIKRTEENRKLGSECRSCYYTNRIAFDIISFSRCKNCGKDLYFGSSDIDKYCLDCAKEKNVCKHCGKEID